MRGWRPIALAVAALPLLAAVPEDTILVNGTFDEADQLAGWTDPSGNAFWSSADADMVPGSGSAWFRHDSPVQGDNRFLLQCVSVPSLGPFDAGMKTSFADPQGANTGRVFFSLTYWAQPDCTDLIGFAELSDQATPSGLFTPTTLEGVMAPPGTQAVRFQLTVVKLESGGLYEVYFDDVFLPEPRAEALAAAAVLAASALRLRAGAGGPATGRRGRRRLRGSGRA